MSLLISYRFGPLDNPTRYASDWLPGQHTVSRMELHLRYLEVLQHPGSRGNAATDGWLAAKWSCLRPHFFTDCRFLSEKVGINLDYSLFFHSRRTCSLTAMTTEVRSLSSSFSMINFFSVRLKSLSERKKGLLRPLNNISNHKNQTVIKTIRITFHLPEVKRTNGLNMKTTGRCPLIHHTVVDHEDQGHLRS